MCCCFVSTKVRALFEYAIIIEVYTQSFLQVFVFQWI